MKTFLLHKSKWGWCIIPKIPFPNGRVEAFCDGYPEPDFYVGKEINVNIIFKVLYKEKDKDPKNPKARDQRQWQMFNVKTYEEAVNHPEYIRDELKPNSIVPYFKLIK